MTPRKMHLGRSWGATVCWLVMAVVIVPAMAYAQTYSADLAITNITTTGVSGTTSDVRWTVQVSNKGPGNATEVTLTTKLDQQLTLITATAPRGCSQDCEWITCRLGSIAAQANGSADIVFRTNARVSYSYLGVVGNELDSDLSNNTLQQRYPPRLVVQIDPLCCPVKRGPTRGGTTVVITGAGFDPKATVAFGDKPAASVQFETDGRLTAVTPPHEAATVDIIVSNPDGQRAVAKNAFTFSDQNAPTIASMDPHFGPVSGAIPITITGTGIVSQTQVFFDSVQAATSNPTSTSITATLPPHALGSSWVVLKNPDGSQSNSAIFSYVNPPTLSAISPTSGSALGGDRVTITGAGIFPGAKATVGGIEITSPTIVVNGDTQTISGFTQAHVAGVVGVVVTNRDTQSGTLPQSYTYLEPLHAPTNLSFNPATFTFTWTAPDNAGPGDQLTYDLYIGGPYLGPTSQFHLYPTQSPFAIGPTLYPALYDWTLRAVSKSRPYSPAAKGPDFTVTTPGPKITSITPSVGSTAGGTAVRIAGTGFNSGTRAYVGGLTLTGLAVTSNEIRGTTAPHAIGYVAVYVTNPDSQQHSLANAFQYKVPPGAPTGLAPASGISLVETTTSATLSWTAVTGAVAYAVRAKDLTDPNLRGFNDCNVPPQPPIYVCKDNVSSLTYSLPVQPGHSYEWWVHAISADGLWSPLANAFFFVIPAAPANLNPNGATLPASTTSVTLSWSVGVGATQSAVRVKDNTDGTIRDSRNNCANPTVYLCVDGIQLPTTTYSVAVQAGHSYTWWVHAGNSAGKYSAQTNGSFAVGVSPTVTTISPLSGTTAGGTVVTIGGTNFRSGATVTFGGVPATGVTVVSATVITATTGAHACGSVDVVVRNSDGTSASKAAAYFYSSPPSPTGLSPNGTSYSSSTTSVTLTWSATPGADRYAVRVQDNTNGTLRDPRNNCASPTVYLCVDGIAATTYSVPVQAGHSYTWWLQAGNSCGQYSAQTNATFSVVSPIDDALFISQTSPPSCMLPGSTAAASVTMKNTGNTAWDSSYRLGSQNPPDNSTWGLGRVFLAPGETVQPGQQKTFTFNVTMPSAPGIYNFQWRMVHEGVQWFGAFTPNVSTTNKAPAAPTGLTPNGVSVAPGTSVTLSWSATPGADRYAVRVQDNTNGTLRDPRNNCPSNTIYLCVDGVTTTTYTVPVQVGHSYTWWVHAGSSCGQYSTQTNATFSVVSPIDDALFISQTSPPSCMLPGSTAAASVTMKNTGNTAWDSSYRLGSQNPPDNSTWGLGRVFLAPGETVQPGQQKTFTFNVTMPSAPGIYNFQWRMVHEGVQWFGAFTPNVSTTNKAPATSPTGLNPNGVSVAPGTVTLSWSPTPGATKYAIRVQDNTDGTVRDPRNNCPGNPIYLCVDGVASTTYSVPVISGHSYTWWVHAGNCAAYGAQTNATFTVAAAVPPSPPTGLSPNLVSLAAGTTSLSLSWNPTPGATKYAVRLRDDTDGTLRDARNNCPTNTIYLCVDGAVATNYPVTVVPGHSYTWWVHAGNNYGYSAPTYASFTVAVEPLHAPTGLAKEVSPSRNLVWTPPNNLTAADQVTYDLRITGPSCPSGCLYHPAAPSWYTMGAEIGPGAYIWTLKANSVSRPSSGAVSGPPFSMP